MNTHKLPKDEAYQLIQKVRQKYMEQNNGQEPHMTPLTAVSQAELEEALSQTTQPSDNPQVDNTHVDNPNVDNPCADNPPDDNHPVAYYPPSAPVFPSHDNQL